MRLNQNYYTTLVQFEIAPVQYTGTIFYRTGAVQIFILPLLMWLV